MMPAQVTTTQGAHVQALAQKIQARALPRTPRTERASETSGLQGMQASAPAQDFRTLLRRMEAARQERPRDIAS